MGNPKPQESIEIVCAVLKEEKDKLEKGEKSGDATKVEIYGSKDGINIINIEELINSEVEVHDVEYHPEKGSAERRFKNGTKNKVKLKPEELKKIAKEQEELGRVEHVEDKAINDR